MNRVLAPAIFVLAATTCLLWQHQFVRESGGRTVLLRHLKESNPSSPCAEWSGSATSAALTLQHPLPGDATVVVHELPGISTPAWLHVRCKVAAEHLEPGPLPWSDGRLMIEWRAPDGYREFTPLLSARYNDCPNALEACCRPKRAGTTPFFRLEHLGSNGRFIVSQFEATPVRKSPIWAGAKWPVLVALATLLGACVGFSLKRPRLRPFLAIGIWLAMVLVFVVPGPWEIVRPLAVPFDIGQESQPYSIPPSSGTSPIHPDPAPQTTATNPGTTAREPLPPTSHAGEIKPELPLLRLKEIVRNHCQPFKPVFHIPLLLLPSLLSLALIDKRRTILIAAATGIAIEAAQAAFGYSLDWQDALDITGNFIGIWLATWIYRHTPPALVPWSRPRPSTIPL